MKYIYTFTQAKCEEDRRMIYNTAGGAYGERENAQTIEKLIDHRTRIHTYINLEQ